MCSSCNGVADSATRKRKADATLGAALDGERAKAQAAEAAKKEAEQARQDAEQKAQAAEAAKKEAEQELATGAAAAGQALQDAVAKAHEAEAAVEKLQDAEQKTREEERRRKEAERAAAEAERAAAQDVLRRQEAEQEKAEAERLLAAVREALIAERRKARVKAEEAMALRLDSLETPNVGRALLVGRGLGEGEQLYAALRLKPSTSPACSVLNNCLSPAGGQRPGRARLRLHDAHGGRRVRGGQVVRAHEHEVAEERGPAAAYVLRVSQRRARVWPPWPGSVQTDGDGGSRREPRRPIGGRRSQQGVGEPRAHGDRIWSGGGPGAHALTGHHPR